MQDSVTFRFRLTLSFWLLLLFAAILPSWYLCHRLYAEIRAEAKENAVLQLRFVLALMDRRPEAVQDLEHLQNWLAETGGRFNARLTYIGRNGDVLCDSHVPSAAIPNLDSFSGRPEFTQAMEHGTGTDIRKGRFDVRLQVFAAQPIPGGGAAPPAVLRVAVPAPHALELLNGLYANYLYLLAAALIVTFFLARFLSNLIRRSAEAVSRITRAVVEDDYAQRVRFHPAHEFYPLGTSVDEMTRHIAGTVQWITEEKHKLEAVLNGMQEGVMVLDAACRIQIVNRALSGVIPDAAFSLGRRPLEVLVNLELHDACLQVLSAGGEAPATPHFLQIEIGRDRVFDVTIARLDDEDGNPGAIVVFHDISNLKRLERVRQDFVANVSHELRTPLTSIKGYAETLLSDPKPDLQTEHSFLQVILKNTNHMVKMVDDLLQLARLEARAEPLKPQPVNPSDALAAAWKACFSLAEPKRVRLEDLLPKDEIRVSADYGQLVQVFRNLLENGIRYSPQESVLEVSCKVEGGKVVFSIHDNGPGIAKQHQRRVFERFYRVEKHRGTLAGSTGLGLSICRHIVENYRGRIWVRSPDPGSGGGTTFQFSLPGSDAPQDRHESEGSGHIA
ncbi:MAG: ATP-binding protein [Syntrophobacteraceae bacterium]|nr:PAS domain-containing protein [Desulfobacteraceae bacterium]